MKAETYKTLLAMDKADPMTPAQRKALAKDGDDDEILTVRQVSELTGLSVERLRKRKRELPPLGFSRFLRYKKRDVMAFIQTAII